MVVARAHLLSPPRTDVRLARELVLEFEATAAVAVAVEVPFIQDLT